MNDDTTTDMIDVAAIVAELVDDAAYGAPATVTLPDGRTMRLTIEPDPFWSIMDEQGEGTWCGRLEWSTKANGYGWNTRPEGFNGRARVLIHDGTLLHPCNLWWQPPADCLADPGILNAVESEIRDLLECGAYVVTVEVCGPDVDAYRRPVVHGACSIGGVFRDLVRAATA